MTLYAQDKRHQFKWVLGFVIFVLVLSVTFGNVYGWSVPPAGAISNGSLGGSPPDWYVSSLDTYQYPTDNPGTDSPDACNPPEVPEPTTLILLASGLGALRLMRRKND